MPAGRFASNDNSLIVTDDAPLAHLFLAKATLMDMRFVNHHRLEVSGDLLELVGVDVLRRGLGLDEIIPSLVHRSGEPQGHHAACKIGQILLAGAKKA